MTRIPRHLKPRPLAALLFAGLVQAATAQQLPSGMTVVAGQAAAQQLGSQLTITNANNTILNWQSFSIGAGASVRFNQPSGTSRVLNRVTGNDPSSLLGGLSSNGAVWLLNPNGVLFGANARVDVASLVTSTLGVADADWRAGRALFTAAGSGPAASIDNQGQIRTALGGRVALVGGSVSNEGSITADGGQIVLAAGQTVELVDTGAPNLAVKVTAPSGQAVNLGSLSAGRIDVMAAAVNQQGIVEADSLSAGPAGEIVLQAADRLTLAAGSSTHADGTGAASSGGQVQLLGKQVELDNFAAVSASGQAGGGTVLVGGGAQGKDPSVPNADAVYFAPGASIAANAVQSGDGGHIVLWSNRATRAFGALGATGGATGGDGGLIETSGGWLAADPSALHLAAPLGRAGTWLLDPYNITISNGADSNYDTSFTATGNDAVINATTLANALTAGNNVTVSTSGATPAGTQAGTITMNSVALNVFATTPVTLTLNADSSIYANGLDVSQSSSAGGKLNLVFQAGGGISVLDSSLVTNGGNVTLHGTGNGAYPDGILLSQATITAGAGAINLNGSAGASAARGVALDAGLTGSNLSGSTITIAGQSTAGTGVQISDGIVTATGAISVSGTGGQNGVSVVVGNPNTNPIALSGAGIALTGTTTGTGYGVQVDASAGQPASNAQPVLNANAGTLSLSGTGSLAGSPALGVYGANNLSDQWDTTGPLSLAASGGTMVVSGLSMVNNPATITATSQYGLTWQNLGFSPTGAVSLSGSTVVLSNVNVSALLTSNIAIASAGDTDITSSSLVATDASVPMTVTVNAGTSGAGSLNLSGSTIYSAGGNITLSNAGTPPGGSGAGVSLVETAVNAVAGTLHITGVANGSGAGVLLGTTSPQTNHNALTAGTINVTGTSSTGNGVQINDGQLTSNSGALTLSGTGGADGLDVVYTSGNSTLALSGSSGLTLTGASTGTGYGVLVSDLGANAGTILSTYSVLDVSGTNTAGGSPAVAINAYLGSTPIISGGGDLNIQASGGGLQLGNVIDGGEIGNFTASSSSSLTIGNSGLTAMQAVSLYGQSVTLNGNTTVNAGTGLLVAGPGGSVPAQSFTNGTPSTAPFSVQTGNWIIWLADATAAGALNLGGASNTMTYTYQLYGAQNPSAWTQYAGNGIVSEAAKTATVTGTVATRAYDGTTPASVSNLAVTPGVAGDQDGSIATYTAAFADPNAGTGKAVSVNFAAPPEFMDATGHPVYGYTVVDNLSGTITPATLSGTVTASNKVYDATTAASVAVSGITGFVGSETVGVSATGNFADKNVGNGKAVGVSYQLSNGSGGGLASNYQFQGPANAPTANITPASITFTAGAQDKVYDTTTAATLTGIAITPLGSDRLTVVPGTASFATPGAGTGIAVTASGYTLGGADAGNYTLTLPTGLSANITPAPITFAATVAGKVYDATTAATLLGASVTPLGSDRLTLNEGMASFVDKNAGAAKAVTFSGFSLGGAAAADYTLVAPTGVTAAITPAAITFTASAQNKVYDATTAATLTGIAIAPLGSDQLTVVPGTASFADKNVGAAKAVTFSGFSLGGAAAADYTLVAPTGVTAAIAPATLTYVANPATVQTGAPLPGLSGTVSGFVGGDTLQTATTGRLAFAPVNANLIVPGSYAIDGQGLSAANYQFVQAAGNATALSVVGGGPAAQQAQASAVPVNGVQPVPAPPTSPTTSGVVDLTPPPAVTAQAAAAATNPAAGDFGSVPVASLSAGQLVDLLGARAGFMQNLLGKATGELKQDPGMADVKPCKSLKEAAIGTCLVTDALKLEAQHALAQAPLPAPAPATPAAPAKPGAPQPPAPPVVAAAPVEVVPLFGMPQVRSAALPAIRRKIAVLIGEGRYADTSVPALANSVGDAHAVAAALSQLGYQTVVLDSPDKASVIGTLNRLALEAGPQDSVVIYYAGHGAYVDATGQGYWLAADSRAQDPRGWVSNADIGRLIGQIGARQVALISDSCYSGSLVGAERIRGTPGEVDPGALLAKRAAVVMSSGGNEPVFDAGRDGHSLFAWSLIDNLGRVKAWQLGGNLFERVRFAVARELPQRPQYGAAPGYQDGSDYLFELRELDAKPPQKLAGL
ncbi:MAG: filamentous hemagglutinin N-terminal domain-containing protein [Pelomonas sp.]|nr:filamentous hemagglutinin N-terminal domain-containing protein [Roseateles sp.]